jgi:glucose/arabinose dehydrogenase
MLTRAGLFGLFLTATLGLEALQTVPLPGSWSGALTVVALPDGSLLVAQKSGQVDRLEAAGDQFKAPMPWADLGDNGTSELLGLTVDPEFLSSGYVFAVLKTTKDDKSVVSVTRWRDSSGLVVLNRVLVDDLPSGSERTGGVLKYGPDGKLWLGLGDGGAPAPEVKPEALRSVLLRYNDDGTIPQDNPDPASAVWAWGLRDPSGLAWQPESGRLYALDRGPPIPKGTMDEVNLIEKGSNYGWPKYLGRDQVKGIAKPVIYCSSGHSWVPGGAVFAPAGPWAGSILFAGSGAGVLYRLSLDVKAPSKILFYEELVNGDLGPLVDVAVANDKIYLLSRERLYLVKP